MRLLVAAAREHGGAGVVRARAASGGEARLADPGLAADHHHPPLAAADVVERGEQPVARGVAADERRSLAPGGEGRGERRSGGRARGVAAPPPRISAISARVGADGAIRSSRRSRSASRS